MIDYPRIHLTSAAILSYKPGPPQPFEPVRVFCVHRSPRSPRSAGRSDGLGEIGLVVRAHLRVLVKRILRKHGYPPDKQEKATQTVLEQAEVLSAGWAV